jgi:hypothetical protein
MDLHQHKETIEHTSIQVPHPWGFILFWVGSIVGFISLNMEQALTEWNLIFSLLLKLFSIVSICLSVVIYWDKITANFKQMTLDFKDKFQRRKK